MIMLCVWKLHHFGREKERERHSDDMCVWYTQPNMHIKTQSITTAAAICKAAQLMLIAEHVFAWAGSFRVNMCMCVCVCTMFLFSLLQKIKGDKATSVPDCAAWGKKGVLAATPISSHSTSPNCTFQRNVNYAQLHRTDDAVSLKPQQ